MNIFAKAAEVLSERGHCKDALFKFDGNPNGPAVCAVGALNTADHGDAMHQYEDDSLPGTVEIAQHRANRLLKERGIGRGGLGSPLVHWNNAPETTGEDVILLFKELAARYDD